MQPLRCLLVLLIVLLPASPFAITFPVTKTADTDDGVCDPDCSLREAIEAANTNPGADDVPVPAGNYLLTLGQLTVTGDVSIAGAGQTNTIIDGNATHRVFEIEATSGVVEISGVTIQNGYGGYAYLQPGGGGILNNADLRLTDSTVSNNQTQYPYYDSFPTHGGGIWNSGELTLIDSTVSENVTYDNGGGIYNYSGSVTLANSTVSDNTGVNGSGIANRGYSGIYGGGTVTLSSSTVSGNEGQRRVWLVQGQKPRISYPRGGGIYNSGYLAVTNSTIRGNSANSSYFNIRSGYGGGIANTAELTLTNSTVSGNVAGDEGGGIWNSYQLYYAEVHIANSTVSGNVATGSVTRGGFGGGIANLAWITISNSTVSGNTADDSRDGYGTGYGGGIAGGRGRGTFLDNSIVAANTSYAGANCWNYMGGSLSHNLTDDTSCGFTDPTDLIVADAMLGPLQDNGGLTETHALLPGSPAIDAGSPDCPPPSTDQRGVARPQGATCDIGAVEYLPEPGSSVMLVGGVGLMTLLCRRRSPRDPSTRSTRSIQNNSSIERRAST